MTYRAQNGWSGIKFAAESDTAAVAHAKKVLRQGGKLKVWKAVDGQWRKL